jgi:hypothetical protein
VTVAFAGGRDASNTQKLMGNTVPTGASVFMPQPDSPLLCMVWRSSTSEEQPGSCVHSAGGQTTTCELMFCAPAGASGSQACAPGSQGASAVGTLPLHHLQWLGGTALADVCKLRQCLVEL